MDKFVPYSKMSKRARKELDAKCRGAWGGINPITRKPAPPKAYNRAKAKRETHDLSLPV